MVLPFIGVQGRVTAVHGRERWGMGGVKGGPIVKGCVKHCAAASDSGIGSERAQRGLACHHRVIPFWRMPHAQQVVLPNLCIQGHEWHHMPS